MGIEAKINFEYRPDPGIHYCTFDMTDFFTRRELCTIRPIGKVRGKKIYYGLSHDEKDEIGIVLDSVILRTEKVNHILGLIAFDKEKIDENFLKNPVFTVCLDEEDK